MKANSHARGDLAPAENVVGVPTRFRARKRLALRRGQLTLRDLFQNIIAGRGCLGARSPFATCRWGLRP